MILEQITIENFKCFSNPVSVRLSENWNVVVGKNNSGKSTLLQSLRLFEHTNAPFRGIDRDPQVPQDQTSKKSFSAKVSGPQLKTFLSRNGLGLPLKHSGGAALDSVISSLDSGYFVISSAYSPQLGPMITDLINDQGHRFDLNSGAEHIVVDQRGFVQPQRNQGSPPNIVMWDTLSRFFSQTSFFFHAERLNIADAQITGQSILSSNASNLADVLHTLLNSNRGRFDRFVGYVSEIFPEITDVLTPSNNNPGMVQVQVSIAPRDAERGDLSFSLRDCGTGVSQVLSILYVAIFDTAPRLIVIDEPNSFLHPGAAKQLIRVLKRFPQHQFIVSTRECPELC